MTDAAAAAMDTPPDGPVCVRCGYDLRGIGGDGRCPECGLSVARSAAPLDELGHAPPQWLASLSWGARTVLAVPVLAFCYGQFVAGRIPPLSLGIMFVAPAAFDLAFAAGVWLLTRWQRRFGAGRAAVRWGLRLVALVPLVHTALTYAALSGWIDNRYRSDSLLLGLIPLPALLFLHLRRLALRVLDASLAEHCAIVGVGGSLSIAAGFSGMFVRLPAAVVLIAGVGMLLFFFWSLYLMVRFTIAFARARRQSVAAWGGDA